MVDSHDLIYKTFLITRQYLIDIDKLMEQHTTNGILDEEGYMNALSVQNNLAYSLWKKYKETQKSMQWQWQPAAEFVDYLFDIAKQARNGQIAQPQETDAILCKFNALAQSGKELIYRKLRVLYNLCNDSLPTFSIWLKKMRAGWRK
ncbi:hypothetical protein GCK32_005331 [Trichostrongylus colubriformis]|uniref:Uncharacterized protein n=1 Tax=Trichostrongylus colubriformis TaxID=6319 RepID=A0AAN8ITW8_TRICO